MATESNGIGLSTSWFLQNENPIPKNIMASALDGDFRISANCQKIAKHCAPFPWKRDPEATLIINSDDKDHSTMQCDQSFMNMGSVSFLLVKQTKLYT